MSTAIVRRCLSELSGTQAATTDTELLSRYTERNDSEAFVELVRRHGPVVLATCQRILGTSTDAEDAFQTVFLTLIRSAGSILRPAALPAWLHRTAIRIALRIRTQQFSTTSLPSGAADASDPFADMAWRDLRRVLDEELDRLPEKYRVPLVLCLLDGCTRDEAAERLRCSLNTVKRRLEAGRELLRDRLLRRGVSPILLAVGVFEANGARAFVPPHLIATVLKATAIVSPIPKGIQIFGGFAVRWRMTILATLGIAAITAAIGIASLRPESIPGIKAIDLPPVLKVSKGTEPEKSDDVANALPPGAVAQFGNLRYRVPDRIDSAALSHDGKLFAVANGGSLVRVYEVATWRMVHCFPVSPRVWIPLASVLTFSPDGRYLGYVPSNQYAYVWDLQTGKLAQRLEGGILRGQEKIWEFCAFTSDGLFALSDKDKLYFHDPATGREVRSVPAGNVTHLTCEGRFYIRTVEDPDWNSGLKKRVLGDARTGKDFPALRDSPPWSSSTGSTGYDNVAFSPDGKRVAFSEIMGKEVELWDLDPLKHIATLHPQKLPSINAVAKVGFTTDGRTLFLCIPNADVLRWDARTQKELPRLTVDSEQYYTSIGLFSLPDGKTLLTPFGNGCVKVWDGQSGKEIPIADRYSKGLALSLSPDGKLVAMGDETGRIDLRNAITGSLIRTIQKPGSGAQKWGTLGRARTMVFSPDDELLATTELEKRGVKGEKDVQDINLVRVIRLVNGQTLKEIEQGPVKERFPSLRPIGFTSDGQRLLLDDSAVPKGSMRYWDLETGNLDEKIPTNGYLKSLSPDGKTLVDNQNGEVLLLDPTSGKLRKKIVVEQAPKIITGYPSAWSADSRSLVCVIPGNLAVMLDPVFGRERNRFAALPGERPQLQRLGMGDNAGDLLVQCVDLSPDGKWVVTTGADSVGLWEVATGRQLATFETGTQPSKPIFTPENRDLLIFGNGVGRRWNLIATLTPNPKATATELWELLNKSEAKEAVRAANGLIATATGRDLLREKMPPIKLDTTAAQVKQWIADLGDPAFATRESAEKELTARVRYFETTLRESARTTESPEVKNRLMRILASLESGLTKDELRASRMVRAAEMDGTPQAIELLKGWSQGANGAILTEDAKAALGRIDRLTKNTPR
ncbi:MAG TPA: sigma-70 family RNA polymerase sigma factor [Gemmata sp.]|nr:sigma-70 family RNA polymerase sigma factor [Gemmata sp.]